MFAALAHAGATQTLLHRFEGTPADGVSPVGLIAASDGNFYGTTVGQLGLNFGTVFRLTPAGELATLFAFDGTGGIGPLGKLFEATDGNFYGETYNGPTGSGTIFRISPTGTHSVVYTFSALGGSSINADGARPAGGLIQASDGNFYGNTQSGGQHSWGVIFKLTPAGALTVLHDFDVSASGGGFGGTPWGGLVEAPDGYLYGTTQLGGDFGYGSVFRISKDGDFATLFSFRAIGVAGNNNGGSPLGGLIVGSDGNLYGTTSAGGQFRGGSGFEFGTIYRITPAGEMTILYTFVHAEDGAIPVAELSTRGDGILYGVTNNAGAYNSGTVFRINEDGSSFASLYSFGETAYPLPYADGNCAFAGIVPATDGVLYGTTEFGGYEVNGGCYGMGIAYKLDPPAILPSASITVTPSAFVVGGSATLQWTSSNATSCHGHYGWVDANLPLSGSRVVTPSSVGTYPYYLFCTGSGGTAVANAAVVVNPAPPTLNLSIRPATIDKGQIATLGWSADGADSCVAGGDWSGIWDPTGSVGVAPSPAVTSNFTYALACTGAGGTVMRSVTLIVRVDSGPPSGGSGGGGGGSFDGAWFLLLALFLQLQPARRVTH